MLDFGSSIGALERFDVSKIKMFSAHRKCAKICYEVHHQRLVVKMKTIERNYIL